MQHTDVGADVHVQRVPGWPKLVDKMFANKRLVHVLFHGQLELVVPSIAHQRSRNILVFLNVVQVHHKLKITWSQPNFLHLDGERKRARERALWLGRDHN
jgi:hypothetical protein